jgi:hypothetical protein
MDAGAGRRGFAYDPPDLFEGAALQRVRPSTRDQFVKDEAQAVYIAARTHPPAPELLRAGVFGGHGVEARPGPASGEVQPARIQDLGDAEVQELDLPFRRGGPLGDQDVPWLQVPVDYPPLVGMLDRRARLDEKSQARLQGEAVHLAVLRDGRAPDQLHHEVGEPVRGDPAIQEAGNIGVVQGGQDLALGPEPAKDVLAVHSPADQLEGQLLVVGPVVPAGQENLADPPRPRRRITWKGPIRSG